MRAAALTAIGTACSNFEANKPGNEVQIQMPLRVEADAELEDRLA